MVYNSYVPIYLQAGSAAFAAGVGVLGFGFTPALTGFLMTLDNIASLFIAPFVGMLSDSSKSKMGTQNTLYSFLPCHLWCLPWLLSP